MWRILFLEKSQKSVFRNFLILRILDWSALIWQNGNLEQNMQPSGRERIIKNIFQYKSFEETWETHFWNSANNFSFIRPLQQLFKRGYEELRAGGQDIVGKLWQQLVTRISLSPTSTLLIIISTWSGQGQDFESIRLDTIYMPTISDLRNCSNHFIVNW